MSDGRGLPRVLIALRGIGIGLLLLGAVFKIQHWPFSGALLLAGLCFLCASVLVRLASSSIVARNTLGRDLMLLGVITLWLLNVLHWPGKGLAWAIMIIGAAMAVRSSWDRYVPTRSDVLDNTPHGVRRYPVVWMYGGGTALVVLGTMFRIMHWPYDIPMLIAGLSLLAIWFIVTRGSEDNKP